MAATQRTLNAPSTVARRRAPLIWLLSLGLLLGAAHAQEPPLEALLPSTAVLVLHAGPTAGTPAALSELYAALEDAGAGDTVMRLLAALGADVSDTSDAADGDVLGALAEEIGAACPELLAAWDDDTWAALEGGSVLAVTLSPFSPLPGVLMLGRPADPATAARLQDVLIGCFASGPTLEQDGVSLFILGDGGDLPLVVARQGGTFMAATSPDLLRGAIRLAGGSAEPSHLDQPIGRAARGIMDGGLGITVDFGALAEGFASLTGMLPVGPEEQVLIDRILGSVASIGGYAARITSDELGLRLDSVLTPDPEAGDPGLAALLACEDCAVGSSPLLPAGATVLSGRYLDIRGVVDYIDGWFLELAPLIGEPLDLRGLAAMAGLDLDALLLGWVGERWHSAQLGVRGTDAASWLVGPGSVVTVPVASEAAARTAIAEWRSLLEGDALSGLIEDLTDMVDPFAAASGPALPHGGLLAVREVDYRGVGYERWRIGPTTDVGLTVLAGHLVIGMPARALHAAIDVHHGAPGAATDPVLGPVLSGLPSGATGFAVAEVTRQVEALADLSDLLAAPLATALTAAMAEARRGDPWDDPWGDWGDWEDWGDTGTRAVSGRWRPADRFGAALLDDVAAVGALSVPGSVSAVIGEGDELPNDEQGLVFRLAGLVEGDLVMVEMLDATRSWNMDTYLYLYDVGRGEVIADDDDSPDTSRSELVFVVEPGAEYAVVAGSWSGSDVGPIELNAEVLESADADDQIDVEIEVEVELEEWPAEPDEALVDAPTFAELVGLFDVLTDALRDVAQRAGPAVSVTVVEDGVVRTSMTLPLR
jgi:hypothetical protein